jgi:cytochrome c oxidase cbb3-type subunit 3/ubiquinol-cytochrome c reductase cytochrome c subunit
MRFTSIVVSALAVLVSVVMSGALECSEPAQTVATHGGELYERTCSVCHGSSGEGYKADDAPALSHPEFLASVTDGQLRSAISYGRSGTTMSAWAIERGGPLSPSDVTAVVAHLRSWAKQPRAKLDERPRRGSAPAGEALFARECVRCHGDRGVGGPSEHIGGADLLAGASDGFLRHAIRYGRAGTSMPAFELALGDQGVEDVIAALRNWAVNSANSASSGSTSSFTRAPPLPLGPVPLNPKGPAPVGFKPTPATTPADVIKAALDRGAKLALLDARAPSDYMGEHIAGAVSVPFYDPDPYLDKLPKDAWLVAYCACPHAESGNLARILMTKGFTKVTVLDEGLGYWRNHNYGTHKGEQP